MDYCRMGTRRGLRALLARYTQQRRNGDPTEKPPTIYWWTLCHWSRDHKWQKRVVLWDDHQARLLTEEHNKVIADMNRRHAQMGMIAQQKAVAKLGELTGSELSVSEATRLMVEGTGIERVARGEPVTIETHEHKGPDGGPIPIKYVVVHLSGEEKNDQHDGSDGHDGGDGSQARGEDSALDT